MGIDPYSLVGFSKSSEKQTLLRGYHVEVTFMCMHAHTNTHAQKHTHTKVIQAFTVSSVSGVTGLSVSLLSLVFLIS